MVRVNSGLVNKRARWSELIVAWLTRGQDGQS